MPEKIICTVTNDLVYDQRMQRIAASLQRHEFQVSLVGRILHDSKSLHKMSFAQERLRCFFNKGFLFYAEYNIRLLIYLLSHTFDIVCGCDLDTLPAAFIAARIKRKKVVYDAHEYFPESPELVGRPFKQSIWYLVEKIFVPRVDAVYTVTQSIAALFQRTYGTECEVIRNLPLKNNMKHSAISADMQVRVLLYQGAVNIGRGLNEMLLLMLRMEGVEFQIVGGGDEWERIRHSIQELHIEDKVKLLGKKTPDELRQLTQQAYIGINLLENRGLSYYYSLGNKTFDYIQAGIPQVLIGFPEYIALNNQYNIGIVVKELHVDQIHKAIQQLLTDKELYRQLQLNCHKASDELCWEQEEKKLLSIYKMLR